MLVDDDADELTVIPTRAFERHEFIDGGDTVVLWLRGSDGGRVAVMLPRQEMRQMVNALAEAGESDPSRGRPAQMSS